LTGEFGSSAFRPSVPLFSTSNQQPTTFGYAAAFFSGVDIDNVVEMTSVVGKRS
jgi:hypothetical protein